MQQRRISLQFRRVFLLQQIEERSGVTLLSEIKAGKYRNRLQNEGIEMEQGRGHDLALGFELRFHA